MKKLIFKKFHKRDPKLWELKKLIADNPETYALDNNANVRIVYENYPVKEAFKVVFRHAL